MNDMTLAEAYRVAEQVSPLPHLAHRAMQVLVGEIQRLQPPQDTAEPPHG